MERLGFIAQAKVDDEEFISALSYCRNVTRKMNLDYGTLRRQAITSVIPRSAHPAKRSAETGARPAARMVPGHRNKASVRDEQNELFVVTNLRVKAKKPSPGGFNSPNQRPKSALPVLKQ
jgi:hypothetical protein